MDSVALGDKFPIINEHQRIFKTKSLKTKYTWHYDAIITRVQ
jgi:hypothetical protein